MHDTREKEDHIRWRTQDLGRRLSGEGEEVEWEVFGREKRDFLLREIREKWEKKKCAEPLYRNMKLDGSRAIEDLLSTNSRQTYMSRCYRELSKAKKLRWIKQLSSIYWADRKFLDGSRICIEAIETNSKKFWWIEIVLTSVEKGRSKVLIDSKLLRVVEKLLRCAKTVFQRREKHKNECNQACYSTKDPVNIISS